MSDYLVTYYLVTLLFGHFTIWSLYYLVTYYLVTV